MKLLIKQATIADPSSPFNGLTQDILIIDGTIISIASNIEEAADQVIAVEGLHISQGWVDLFCQFNDPGAEHKETLESGATAAAAGGFTDVFLVPNTSPIIHSKSQVEYVVQKSASLAASVHPAGAITKNCEGKELAEMYDMKSSGAIAFTDGWNPVQSGQVMLKALQYVKAFGGVIIQVPDEISLSKNGLMNEGIISTQLGLPGKPAIAESLMVVRDIELLRYTQSRLHLTGISTAAGIDLVRKAKAEGLYITCSVTPYHLNFTDEDLTGYDTNLKVNPALRTKADVEALKAAVLDGTVDCISSHHHPQDWDNKVCEFEYARYGMEGLESSAGAVLKAVPGLDITRMSAIFCDNARKIFNLKSESIDKNNSTVTATLYLPGTETIFTKKQVRSLCTNNAFIGQTLAVKVIGTIRGKRLFLND
ncbi:MAG: dihydroorotase [Chitinophagaceae bacterium]